MIISPAITYLPLVDFSSRIVEEIDQTRLLDSSTVVTKSASVPDLCWFGVCLKFGRVAVCHSTDGRREEQSDRSDPTAAGALICAF